MSCESLLEFYDRGNITVQGCHLQKFQASQIVFIHLAHVIEFSQDLSHSYFFVHLAHVIEFLHNLSHSFHR